MKKIIILTTIILFTSLSCSKSTSDLDDDITPKKELVYTESFTADYFRLAQTYYGTLAGTDEVSTALFKLTTYMAGLSRKLPSGADLDINCIIPPDINADNLEVWYRASVIPFADPTKNAWYDILIGREFTDDDIELLGPSLINEAANRPVPWDITPGSKYSVILIYSKISQPGSAVEVHTYK